METVFEIIHWAQMYNQEPVQSFPVIAVKYAMAAALACQTSVDYSMTKIEKREQVLGV